LVLNPGAFRWVEDSDHGSPPSPEGVRRAS
jgi:hypothetical protein